MSKGKSKSGSSKGRTAASKAVNVGSSPTPLATPKVGRPSLYTPEIVEAICERLGKGEPLACICREDGMPAYRTVKDWMDEKDKDGEPTERGESVSAAISRARESGFDAIAHRVRETARGDGDSRGDVARDRLIVETDLKLLAKWDPKRYGDKVQHADADGGKLPAPPPPAVINVIGVEPSAK